MTSFGLTKDNVCKSTQESKANGVVNWWSLHPWRHLEMLLEASRLGQQESRSATSWLGYLLKTGSDGLWSCGIFDREGFSSPAIEKSIYSSGKLFLDWSRSSSIRNIIPNLPGKVVTKGDKRCSHYSLVLSRTISAQTFWSSQPKRSERVRRLLRRILSLDAAHWSQSCEEVKIFARVGSARDHKHSPGCSNTRKFAHGFVPVGTIARSDLTISFMIVASLS